MRGRQSDRRRRTMVRVAVFALLAALVLAVPSLTSGAVHIEGVTEEALPDFDARATVDPSAAQLAAAKDLGADVRWNEFGTPSSVYRHGGFVATGVAGADSASAARAWLVANKALFRLDSTDGLVVASDGTLAGSTTSYAVVFRQQFDGLVAGDGVVTVGLARTNSGWNVTYASSSLTGAQTLTNAVELTPEEGYAEGANGSGADVSTDDVSVAGTSNDWTVLDVKGLPTKQYVRKSAFPTPHRGARAAYESTVTMQGDAGTQSYRTVVDAETGDLLIRESLTDNAVDDPTWLVFPQWPNMTDINEYPWNYPSADVRDLWCWVTLPSCKYEIAESASLGPNVASKVEWDKNAETNVPTFQTTGNNADAIERWVNQGARVYGVGHHAVSPTRDYVYPWTNIWFEDKCNPANLAANGNDIDAAMANLFAMHNAMHDYAYHLGFDERHWNAQQFNYGTGTLDRDAVLGNAQSAAVSGGFPNYGGRDNANMNTPRDGLPPTTNMFLWQPLAGAFYAPCVDGDYDMGVIAHEYGHAIENRMISKGLGARQGNAAGAMGEAFGDFDAVEYLSEAGFVPRMGEKSPFVEGAFATGNPIKGIRNYDMSWAMGGLLPQPGKDPYINSLNYSDFGYDTPGPEVHSDGEIWIAVQFDIRDLFLDRYPSQSTKANRECLRGDRPADACPGNRRWIQDYYDAMVLMPRNPTMLDARNAMLAADVARFGGANVDLLWLAFAERGFGQLATTNGTQDTDPIPDFSSPVHGNSTLVFNAVAKDGSPLPVNANIYVGDYEARATPIADTNPATVGPNRDNVVPIVPSMYYVHGNNASRYRAYNFIANAPGYGHVRFVIGDLKPGETRNVTIQFPTNYASRSQGAVATGNGQDHDSLIDDLEGTNWGEAGAPVQGQQVVVKLGQGVPVTFSVVNVSALLTGFAVARPGQPPRPAENRFTALREFEVYACTAGADAGNPNCEGGNDAGWKRILNSQKDAFPGVNPRPVAPDQLLRSWSVPTTTATHVRLVVINNQCTGQPSFQGDQDNDPGHFSDCRTGSGPTFPPRSNEVHAAELQVWSSKPVVIGAKKEE
jgi:extracellular elastinolytic metalloproteinase